MTKLTTIFLITISIFALSARADRKMFFDQAQINWIKKVESLKKKNVRTIAKDKKEKQKSKAQLIKKPVDFLSKLKKKTNQPQYTIHQFLGKYSSWGINPSYPNSNVNIVNAWKAFKKKKDIIVAVIDTGIDPTHPYLKDNLYVVEGSKSNNNYGKDFSVKSKSNTKPVDQHGHGTHVSGIIRSVFPEVKILPLKYFSPKQSGQDNLVATIKALEYAVKMNVDIINYSGGGPQPSYQELKILKEAEKKGILVVAAAGNESSDIDINDNAYYPASYGLSNIITVTAHNQSLNILGSSNFGQKSVDVSAPGYRIKSSIPANRAAFMTGTSQATAFVSGIAALIKSQFPKVSASKLKEIISNSVTKRTSLSKKCKTGGSVDALKALNLAESLYGSTEKQRKLAAQKK